MICACPMECCRKCMSLPSCGTQTPRLRYRSHSCECDLRRVPPVATANCRHAAMLASQSRQERGHARASGGAQHSGQGSGSHGSAKATGGAQHSGQGSGSQVLISAEAGCACRLVLVMAEIVRNWAANSDVNNTRLIMLRSPPLEVNENLEPL